MGGFDRDRRSGLLIGAFTGFEADLLRSLAGQLVELLRSERPAPGPVDPLAAELGLTDLALDGFDLDGVASGPVPEPEDPVLRRLLPSAYDDEGDAAEFRRYTETSLREGKAAGATALIEALEDAGLPPQVADAQLMIDVELDEPAAVTWLKSLTDLRLALATRLGIEDEEPPAELLADDDPRAFTYGVYEWLGVVQDTLVDALSAR